MCIYVYVFIYLRVYIHTPSYFSGIPISHCLDTNFVFHSIHTYTYIHINIYIYIYVYVYICLCLCEYIYTHPATFRAFQSKIVWTRTFRYIRLSSSLPSSVVRGKNSVFNCASQVFLSWSVLQCVAVWYSVLQCVAVCCGVCCNWWFVERTAFPADLMPVRVSCVAVCCSLLQSVAACCSVLQRVAMCWHWWFVERTAYSAVRVNSFCVTVCRSVLQCVAVCCSVLQCGAVW